MTWVIVPAVVFIIFIVRKPLYSAFIAACRKLSGSTGAAIVAVFGVVGASCVSIYSAPILAQGEVYFKGFFADLKLPQNWQLLLTVTLIVVAIILVGMRELGLGLLVKTREKELDERISTLPSQDFLRVYGDGLRQIGEIRRETKVKHVNSVLTPDVLDESIRSVMKHVLGLARLWDGISKTDEHMVYRSNLMMVVHPELMQDFRSDRHSYEDVVVGSPFFLYGDNFLSRVDSSAGLLMIEDERWTVTSKAKGTEPDKSVKPLCLPFSLPSSGKQPNLPGAPEALVSKTSKYVGHTIDVMYQWLKDMENTRPRFSQEFKQGIKDYYGSADHAQSILSIPIVFEGKVMAIFNIYRNKDGIFKGEDRAQQFVSLMNPVCYHIAKMLSLAAKLA